MFTMWNGGIFGGPAWNPISVASWAKKHGIPRNIVIGVLKGKLKGKRGHAHNAAVLLGLKEGVVTEKGDVE